MGKYKKDDIAKGTVSGIEEYGAFINLDDGYTGLVHISEISNGFVSDIYNFFDIGEEVFVKVLDVDDEDKKLKLSIKYRTEGIKVDKGIREIGTGFKPLKDNLDGWIDKKKTEIEAENVKIS